MKKLIMIIIMVIMGTISIAEENHPDNWMIWDRSYATFAEASKVIKYWGADAPSQYLKCTIDTNDSYVWDNGTHLDILLQSLFTWIFYLFRIKSNPWNTTIIASILIHLDFLSIYTSFR